MRTAFVISALAALAVAAPYPQDVEFDQVDAAPDVSIVAVSADATPTDVPIVPVAEVVEIAKAAVTDVASTDDYEKRSFLGDGNSLSKRDGDCSPLPDGTGPTINNPDTPQGFLAYQPFHTDAQNAALAANVPQGYSLAFSDLRASSQTVSYLGYELLDDYDVIQCARICDAKQGCHAFNIYYERDPSLKANSINCPNPPSNTNIKCVRWGVAVSAATAKNDGGYRAQFKVTISGSNGYNKNAAPSPQPGFFGPVALGGAINAPLDPVTNTNTYMGYKFFSFAQVQTFDNGARSCTAACTAQTAYNSRHPPKVGNPNVCNQVVVYVLSDENVPQGIYCAMYTEEWAPVYADNYGQYRGSHYWSNSQAYSYTNANYHATYQPICNEAGCPRGSYKGGNCGGYGGTC